MDIGADVYEPARGVGILGVRAMGVGSLCIAASEKNMADWLSWAGENMHDR